MSTIKKLFFCFILILAPLYGNDGIDDDSASAHCREINYPVLELSGGFGLIWLLQFNTTISPTAHFYFQPRFSVAVIANEVGFTVGYQTRHQDDKILRMGVGVSKGGVASLEPGGGEDDEWESLYLRLGVLTKWKDNSIINPNINITRLGGRAILSGNVTFCYCIFRK